MQWLMNKAQQLGQILELLEEKTKAKPNNPKDYLNFLRKTLQKVSENPKPQVIYPFWAQNLDKLDDNLIHILDDWAKNTLSSVNSERACSIASATYNFSNLIQLFSLGNIATNKEIAILGYEIALTIFTFKEFPVEWAVTHNNLAAAYLYRIRGDKAENLEQAIICCREALKVRTFDKFPQDWAETQNNFATAYLYRIREDRAENLEKAITYYEEALKVKTFNEFPQQWAVIQNNLALAYLNRIREDKAENLEQAIICCREALKVRTFNKFPQQWANTQNNLGEAYRDRIRGDKAENIEKAITCYERALKVRTFDKFPQDWAMTQNNLALAYHERIRGEKAENLEKAIICYERALKVITFEAFPQGWAQIKNNFATAYLYRIRGDKAENIEKTIIYYQEALKVYAFDAFPQDWAQGQNNLGNAYLYRIREDKAENIEKAIIYYQEALKIYAFDAFPVEWARTQNNLAAAYSDRLRGEKTENLEQAIAYYQEALKVYTFDAFPLEWARTQNNLALTYQVRLRDNKAENLEKAITACNEALKIRRPKTLPEDCRRTARLLGNLYAQENRWKEAIKPYQTALEAVEVLYEDAVTLLGKEDVLSATDDLFHRTAYALARVGDLESAVVTLERGRARNLRETLARDRADLETVKQLNSELYDSYYGIANELRNSEQQERMRMTFEGKNNLGATPESNLQLIQQTRQRLKTILADIRKLPGYENFLALPTFAEITQAVTPNKLLIYLTTTEYGSLALIVYRNATEVTMTPVQVDSLNDAQLRELLGNEGWFGAYINFRNNPQENYKAWLDTIDRITNELWSKLMESVIIQLKKQEFTQAILIPTGLLSLLPLHAAWTEDKQQKIGRKYALDEILFTYIPNALSLTSAREIAQNTPADSILAIDEPLPVNANRLPNSALEVQTAIESFPNHRIFKHEEATKTDVKNALNHYTVAHFSCHGFANLTEPLQSGLLMAYDQILSLQDLFELNLKIRLAILSACETSLPGIDTIDEVVSLPTGLLQTGVAGVVASLWSVSDISTMMLMARFYDFWRKDNIEPSEALLKAQKWIRDTTNGEKVDYFKTFLPEFSTTKTTTETADFLYKKTVLKRKDAYDFAHPFHWAAFGYHGV